MVGVFEKRPKGNHFMKFPDGVIYSIEFEDGTLMDVHEGSLQFIK